MSARKIGLLLLILGFGAIVETAWHVRGDVRIGPEGCRVIGGRFYGPSYAFEQSLEQALPAGQTPRLEIRNAFGGVRVAAGAPGVVRVKLRKVVFLPTEEKARAFAERVELRLSADGATVRVATNRDEIDRRQDVGFETHLEIETPPDSAVEVRSEHGRVDLAGVASADVTSSFDGVAAERVAGPLKLEARNGDVRVGGVGGTLDLAARHGNVEVSEVAGASKLDVEHGDVSVKKTGALEASVSYGALTAEVVAGDLVVRGSRSEVQASDVAGRAEVETSYAGIHLARVGGEVRAKAKHGEVTAEDVGGPLFAETTHADVRLDRVDGPVEATADRGGVEARGLAGGARVRATAGDVSLDGFAGPVDVEVQRGSARLSPRAALTATVVASATSGEVRRAVPEGSRFDLEAESRRGELRADVPGLALSETGGRPGRGQRATGRLAGGGPAVRLRADGDVVLEPATAGPIADREVAKPAAAAAVPAAEAPLASPEPAAKPRPKATPSPEAEAVPPRPEAEKPEGGPGTR